MTKKPRRVKLLVGFSNWAGPKHRKEISYNPDYKKAAIDGEIAFGNGVDRVSSGLIRFNKRGTKANIYWDKNLDGFVSGGDGLAYNSSSGVFSVNTSNGIEINSDSVELDYEIVSTAPSGVGSTATGHLWFVV